tara:strand:+ start:9728 stop:11152 length:1425 start_codon:yes stop_codon:yes gene_type:complete
MTHLIILPNQLFTINYIKDLFNNESLLNYLKTVNTNKDGKINFSKLNDLNIILYEHPQYFTKYNYNKKRLLLHRASMKYYYDYLKSKKVNNIKYINYSEKLPKSNKNDIFIMFDPIDKIKLPYHIKHDNLIESPNFMLTKNDYTNYRQKTKTFFFNSFYNNSKKIVDIIPNIKSTDKQNRERMPKDVPIPKLLTNKPKKDKEYIDEAILYVNKHFPKNYGTTDEFQFPISHTTANKWLKNFVDKKLKDFGTYQDFIIQDEEYLFHSCLSTSLNCGLLNPTEIIDLIRPLKDKFPINSYEGYIRQLFWREYQRFCYIHFDFSNKNYFGNNKKLGKEWYTGKVGIKPVDDAIISAFKYGYLHHIRRLMVIGNFMNLSEIDPMDGLKWFIEFACDSYEWVMYQNVLDMAFCVSGGGTMRKPYISSSNYILKMSNYSKKDDWVEKWDKMYRDFLDKHKKKILDKFAYAYAMRYRKSKK